MKVYNDIKEQNKKIDYTKLVCNGSGNHHYNFTNYMSLGNFAEIIYHSNIPINSAKNRQRDIKEMIRSLENYNPNKEKYKTQKISTFANAR